MSSKINVFCQKSDKYANPISLTFAGKKKYYTAYGGCFTWISGAIIITWLAFVIKDVINRDFTFQIVESLTESPDNQQVYQIDSE